MLQRVWATPDVTKGLGYILWMLQRVWATPDVAKGLWMLQRVWATLDVTKGLGYSGCCKGALDVTKGLGYSGYVAQTLCYKVYMSSLWALLLGSKVVRHCLVGFCVI